jgi:hypothetical protein
MRWKATIAGAGLVLLAGTACGGPAKESNPQPVGQPAASSAQPPGEATGAVPPPPAAGTMPRGPGMPVVPAPAEPPAAGRTPVAAAQLDAAALPPGYPREVSVGPDGKTLMVKAQEGGCGHALAEAQEQSDQRVVVNLVETIAQTHQMCTMDIRYPTVSVQLAAPLGNRTVVLHSERRKV